MIGTRLAHYTITAKLGEGGMGEVYCAADARLGRNVALKVLPEAVASDPERLERFRREARSVATLNHPNIVTIYSVEEVEGLQLLTMELVEGDTLADRSAAGALELDTLVDVARQLASGLEAAHAKGVIHRDLKPQNVMVAADGAVKILDFGLAKLQYPDDEDDSASRAETEMLTRAGVALGTPAYMAPEQATGGAVDARTDVFALGVLLYEAATGRRPFTGDSVAETMAAVLRSDPPSVRDLRPEVPATLAALIERCLAKDPEARCGSAKEVRAALDALASSGAGGASAASGPRLWAAAGLAVVALAALGGWWALRQSRVAQARARIPEVESLIGETRLREAAELAIAIEETLGEDPVLAGMWPQMVTPFRITSEPAGATVSYRPYESTDGGWRPLGSTPFESDRFPAGAFRFKLEKNGHEPVLAARSLIPENLLVELKNAEFDYLEDASYVLDVELPSAGTGNDMVAIGGGLYGTVPVYGFPSFAPRVVPPYFIDRTEVTNEAYEEFVAAGGYDNPEFWESFARQGRPLSWSEAMGEFRDTTGRPGPATWVLGKPPADEPRHPVSGVSWFEASAYCRWKGKGLPTLYHWARATLPSSDNWIAFNSMLARKANFDRPGPVSVASRDAIGISGAHDLAGNVREWVSNAAGDERHLVGGAWSDPTYFLQDTLPTSPWQRFPTDGFRCASYPEGEAPEHLRAALRPRPEQVFVDRPPIPDAVFDAQKSFHAYDRTRPLNASIDSSEELDWGATRVWVSVDSAYGERLPIRLHLPTGGRPPYQAVVFYGGGNFIRSREMEEPQPPLDTLVRSGRVLVEPAYDGTFMRNDGRTLQRLSGEGRAELMVHWVQDLGRTLDYLAQRPDFDEDKVSYLGLSLGASLLPYLLPFEDRFGSAVIYSGGFGVMQSQEAIDRGSALARRVRVPILMLGGRHDFNHPPDSHQRALLEALGAAAEDKRYRLYDAGHWPLPMSEVIRETVDFLDHYHGPVVGGAGSR